MMQIGMDGVFVGSGIFKSEDPQTMAEAIVLATTHYDDPDKVAEAMSMMAGAPMKGDELSTLEVRLDERGLVNNNLLIEICDSCRRHASGVAPATTQGGKYGSEERDESRAAARKQRDKWKAKRWFTIRAPRHPWNFQRIGETLGESEEHIVGRVYKMTQQEFNGDFTKMHVLLHFRVTEVLGQDVDNVYRTFTSI